MTAFYAKGNQGHVEFDGQFITITRKGFARVTYGKGSKDIPVEQVTAVQWKPAGKLGVPGVISFSLAGASENQSRFGRQTADACQDENSVLFLRKQQPAFEELRDAVKSTIAARGLF